MSKPKLSKLQRKNWWKMTDAEREAAWEEIDRLGPRLDELARPMTKAERDRLLGKPTKKEYDAKRGRGRPKLGGIGAKSVLISIEPSLLSKADAYAKANGLSRSAFFSRCVASAVSGT